MLLLTGSIMLTRQQSYHEGHGHAYENYGIDSLRGCSVILRPDQYISWIGEMDDFDSMNKFFRGFMIDQRGKQGSKPKIANGTPPSKKSDYTGTVAGTNGLRASSNGGIDIKAGDEAVKGTAGV